MRLYGEVVLPMGQYIMEMKHRVEEVEGPGKGHKP